jgi:sec-independent protein translocase protein TatA
MLRNGLEPWHVLVLLVVVLLVFGGKKLPELARGSGRALRIFKAETKGLLTDDDDDDKPSGELDSTTAARSAEPTATGPVAQPPIATQTPPVDPQPEAVRHDAGTD